jgi:transposase
MPDLATWLEAHHGVSADPSNLSKLLCRAGFTYKKTLLAAERERADVRRERDEWREHRQPAMRKSPGRLVFVDETSIKTNMTPARGRSEEGERLQADAPFGKWNTQTFIAGLRCDAITAPFVVDGAMDGEKFDTYVRTQLAPTLKEGDVVIWDNLNVHKSPRAAAAIAERKAWILFLPRYSPDLNPIEMASRSSRPCCESTRPEPTTTCGRPSARSATCSHNRNAGTISGMQDALHIKRPTF